MDAINQKLAKTNTQIKQLTSQHPELIDKQSAIDAEESINRISEAYDRLHAKSGANKGKLNVRSVKDIESALNYSPKSVGNYSLTDDMDSTKISKMAAQEQKALQQLDSLANQYVNSEGSAWEKRAQHLLKFIREYEAQLNNSTMNQDMTKAWAGLYEELKPMEEMTRNMLQNVLNMANGISSAAAVANDTTSGTSEGATQEEAENAARLAEAESRARQDAEAKAKAEKKAAEAAAKAKADNEAAAAAAEKERIAREASAKAEIEKAAAAAKMVNVNSDENKNISNIKTDSENIQTILGDMNNFLSSNKGANTMDYFAAITNGAHKMSNEVRAAIEATIGSIETLQSIGIGANNYGGLVGDRSALILRKPHFDVGQQKWSTDEPYAKAAELQNRLNNVNISDVNLGKIQEIIKAEEYLVELQSRVSGAPISTIGEAIETINPEMLKVTEASVRSLIQAMHDLYAAGVEVDVENLGNVLFDGQSGKFGLVDMDLHKEGNKFGFGSFQEEVGAFAQTVRDQIGDIADPNVAKEWSRFADIVDVENNALQQQNQIIHGVADAQEQLNQAESKNPPAQLDGETHNKNAVAIQNEALAQEQLATKIKETQSLIKNQQAWLKTLDPYLNDANYATTGKKAATDQLRDATQRLINYRRNPEEYAYESMAEQKRVVDWNKAYQEAQRQGVADSTLTKYYTDATSQYEEALQALQKERDYRAQVLKEAEAELQVLQQQANTQNQINTAKTQESKPVENTIQINNETGAITQQVQSYEQLCQIVERYNHLVMQGGIKTPTDFDTYDSVLDSLEGVMSQDQLDRFETQLDVNTLAQQLGIEIPQAATAAEGAINGVVGAQERLNVVEAQNSAAQDDTGAHNANAEAIRNEIEALNSKIAKIKEFNGLLNTSYISIDDPFDNDLEKEIKHLNRIKTLYSEITGIQDDSNTRSIDLAKNYVDDISRKMEIYQNNEQYMTSSDKDDMKSDMSGYAAGIREAMADLNLADFPDVYKLEDDLIKLTQAANVTQQAIDGLNSSLEKQNAIKQSDGGAEAADENAETQAIQQQNQALRENINLKQQSNDQTGTSVVDTGIISGGAITDGGADVSTEASQLTNLQNVIAAVTTAVAAKTQAFTAEEAEVKRVVASEIGSLGELEQKLLTIKGTLEGLLSNLKTGQSDIGAGLGNITVTVNKTDGADTEQKGSWALDTTAQAVRTSIDGVRTDLGNVITAIGNINIQPSDVNSSAMLATESTLGAVKAVLDAINGKIVAGTKGGTGKQSGGKTDSSSKKKESTSEKKSEDTNKKDEAAQAKRIEALQKEIGARQGELNNTTNEGVRQALQEEIALRERIIQLIQEGSEMGSQEEARQITNLSEKTKAAKAAAKEAEKTQKAAAKEAERGQKKAYDDFVKETKREAGLSQASSIINKTHNTLTDAALIDNKTPEATAKVQQLHAALKQLNATYTKINNSKGPVDPADQQALIAQRENVEQLQGSIAQLVEEHRRLNGVNAQQIGTTSLGLAASSEAQQKAITDAVMAATKGRATIKGFNADTNELSYTLKTGANQFTAFKAAIDRTNGSIMTVRGNTTQAAGVFATLGRKIKEYSYYFTGSMMVYRAVAWIREGITVIKEIDTALTELKKVTDATEESYEKFLDTAAKTADKVGSTIKEVVSSTADWARLGYSMKEAAKFAETTQILMNVSEFTDVSQATDTLISSVQAFGYTAETSMDVVDLLNTIGNNYAISTADLAQSLTKSSASLVAAGGDLAEAAALTATANKIVQDADSVGTALKTTSLRLRGTDVSVLEEEGLDSEGAVTSKSKLQSKVKALSGVDILTATGEYKSTYQILSQIADVWEDMNDMDQAECCLNVQKCA